VKILNEEQIPQFGLKSITDANKVQKDNIRKTFYSGTPGRTVKEKQTLKQMHA
jgi:hypothetical protein